MGVANNMYNIYRACSVVASGVISVSSRVTTVNGIVFNQYPRAVWNIQGNHRNPQGRSNHFNPGVYFASGATYA